MYPADGDEVMLVLVLEHEVLVQRVAAVGPAVLLRDHAVRQVEHVVHLKVKYQQLLIRKVPKVRSTHQFAAQDAARLDATRRVRVGALHKLVHDV